MYELTWYRAALCDLLIGRRFRARAAEVLDRAVFHAEAGNEELADILLRNAVHQEWIAYQAEQGHVMWGGRLNRCGYQPMTDDVPHRRAGEHAEA